MLPICTSHLQWAGRRSPVRFTGFRFLRFPHFSYHLISPASWPMLRPRWFSANASVSMPWWLWISLWKHREKKNTGWTCIRQSLDAHVSHIWAGYQCFRRAVLVPQGRLHRISVCSLFFFFFFFKKNKNRAVLSLFFKIKFQLLGQKMLLSLPTDDLMCFSCKWKSSTCTPVFALMH